MSMLDRILSAVGLGFAQQSQAQASQAATLASISQEQAAQAGAIKQILEILNEPAVIAGAQINLGEKEVKNLKAKVDFVLADSGTATGTITFVDSLGEPTAPVSGATVATTATSSDPGVTVSVDATGLVLSIAPASPLPNPLPTGVTISAAIVITNPDASVISVSALSTPVDVVAGGVAGASISLQ